MELYYQQSPLPHDQWFPIAQFGSVTYLWDHTPTTLYTLIMYDVDAPTRSNPTRSPYLHRLIVNIPGDNVAQGTEITDFQLPAPPAGQGEHRYFVSVFAQPQTLPPTRVTTHDRFDVAQFVARNGLRRVAQEVLIAEPESQQMYRAALSDSGMLYDPNHPLIKVDSLISEQQKRYCSCIVSVANKQSPACNTEQAWYQVRDGTQCYNPYAVCTSSVGRDDRECAMHYNYSEFTDDQLQSMAALKGVPQPQPWSREQMIANFTINKQ